MDEKFIHAIFFIKLNEKCKEQERKVFDHYIFRKYPRSNDLYEFFIVQSGLPLSEGIIKPQCCGNYLFRLLHQL